MQPLIHTGELGFIGPDILVIVPANPKFFEFHRVVVDDLSNACPGRAVLNTFKDKDVELFLSDDAAKFPADGLAWSLKGGGRPRLSHGA